MPKADLKRQTSSSGASGVARTAARIINEPKRLIVKRPLTIKKRWKMRPGKLSPITLSARQKIKANLKDDKKRPIMGNYKRGS